MEGKYQLGDVVKVKEGRDIPCSGRIGIVCDMREAYDLLGYTQCIKYTIEFPSVGQADYYEKYLEPVLKQLVKQEETQEITDYRLVVEHNVNIGTVITLSVRRSGEWTELDHKVTIGGPDCKDVKEFLEAVQKRVADWIEHPDSLSGYSGKIVCVESNDSGYIPGKVYVVENGIIRNAEPDANVPAKAFKSVGEINRYFTRYKFIPFVES